MNTTTRYTLFLTLASCLGFAGCSKNADTKSSEQTKAVATQAETTQPENPIISKDLPSDWPADIKLLDSMIITDITHENASQENKKTNDAAQSENKQITGSVTIEDQKAYKKTILLKGEAKDRMIEVGQAIHKNLLSDGWKPNIVMPQNSNMIMQYDKNSNMVIFDIKKGDATRSTFEVVYTEKKAPKPVKKTDK